MEKTGKHERKEVSLLKEIIALSDKQLHLMQERRLEELLRTTEHREKLFNKLKPLLSDESRKDEEVKGLVNVLLEKDSRLTLNIESELLTIKEKMHRIPTRLRALRTYTKIESYSKD